MRTLKMLLANMAWLVLTIAPADADPALPTLSNKGFVGNVLNTVSTSDVNACFQACKSQPACTAFSFERPSPMNTGGAGRCILYAGEVREQEAKGFLSCRMPCGQATVISLPGPIRVPPDGVLRPPVKLPVLPAPVGTVVPVIPVATYTPAILRTAIAGLEVVTGPLVNVPPLSIVTTSAQCPSGKIALSAGYDFKANGDARYGLEMRGAIPDGGRATVLMRNANVFEPGTARALAVCANPPAGLRAITAGSRCAAGERLIGGGYMGDDSKWVADNGPRRLDSGEIDWGMNVIEFSTWAGYGPEPAPSKRRWLGLCAPETSVDGWEYVESVPVALGRRADTTLTLSCPAGKSLLASGVSLRGGDELDLVSNSVLVTASQSSARVMNRNVLGASGPVTVVLSGLCAKRP